MLILGGAGAQATGVLNTPTTGYLLCINSKTKVVTHSGTSTCPKGSKNLLIGAQGEVGLTGPQGPQGSVAPRVTEDNCIGAKCTFKISDIGPGGGFIFFVDYNDQYTGFDYLEASPKSCESDMYKSKTWSSVNISVPVASRWSARAVGAGPSNTAAIKLTFPGDTPANNAAFFASSCTAGGKSDWFLGSLGEMKLMYDNLQGVGDFLNVNYWSSTESGADYAFGQLFFDGHQSASEKGGNLSTANYVRPIRAF
jgi:hypothetical protein